LKRRAELAIQYSNGVMGHSMSLEPSEKSLLDFEIDRKLSVTHTSAVFGFCWGVKEGGEFRSFRAHHRRKCGSLGFYWGSSEIEKGRSEPAQPSIP
jgi:hypothetical protein